MHGIDLSNNNPGFAAWEGVEFAFLKATQGVGFVDRLCATFAAEAFDRRIPRGAYHFAEPDKNHPREEAQHFLDHMPAGCELGGALDVESRGKGATHRDPLSILGAGALAAWVDQWCALVLNATGRDPFLYTTRSYATALATHTARWPLWLATLDNTIPHRWGLRDVAIVQYDIIDGIDRNVNLLPILNEPAPPVPVDPIGEEPMLGCTIHDTTDEAREWVFVVNHDHQLEYHVAGAWTTLPGAWSSLISVEPGEGGSITVTGFAPNPPGQVWRIIDDGNGWGEPFAL